MAEGDDLQGDGTLSAAALAGTVLDEEAARQAVQADEILFADDLLPGVGSESLGLKKGLVMGGGATTFVVLLILNSLDELQTSAFALLAPDIRDTFGVGDGTITFIGAISAAFVVLGAVPMGWLADRYRRGPTIGWSSIAFSICVFLSGFVPNAFAFFWARFGVGIAKANTIPVHGSLLADTYPIGIRGRVGAITAIAGRGVAVISPLLVGLITEIANGPGEVDGWRWAYYILGVPVVFFALAAFRLREPTRGQWEKQDVLGDSIAEEDPLPPSMDAAFARLWKIRTLRGVIVGFSAMGFGIFTAPFLENIFLEDEFNLEALDRGIAKTAGGVFVMIALVYVGPRFDRLYRENPSRVLRLIGGLIFFSAFLMPVQYFMPNVPLFVAMSVPREVMLFAAFAMVQPLMQSIVPYRLRGLGSALGTLYIFFTGAVGGGFLAFLFADAWGARTTVLMLSVPTTILGGFLMVRAATFVKSDLSIVVQELQEELDEAERRASAPEDLPALQMNNVDFSYGRVQVLFDIGFEVKKGESLALLGTNGAGKSTILRVIGGLSTPSRGVLRHHGRTITFSSPQARAGLGIQQLPGGRGVFGDMTVRQNLVMGAYKFRHDKADVRRRIGYVEELFPALRGRENDLALNLSGGQQQMLALAITMLNEPDVLMIDELSLGLAPSVVQELLELVDRLREAGQTMVVVEQSINIALQISDRAIFLEKGQIRFEGSAAELLERDDIARAVFLGDRDLGDEGG
ncbi:MAG: MFS transporter [Acidimicrobiales bacterium]|jgi:ABC-type branched-subunit amino acid transport system ATPase component/predicted MFS family arabinose efflux permease|nr:MFS transporter [Acidimicrobiales bacterium]